MSSFVFQSQIQVFTLFPIIRLILAAQVLFVVGNCCFFIHTLLKLRQWKKEKVMHTSYAPLGAFTFRLLVFPIP